MGNTHTHPPHWWVLGRWVCVTSIFLTQVALSLLKLIFSLPFSFPAIFAVPPLYPLNHLHNFHLPLIRWLLLVENTFIYRNNDSHLKFFVVQTLAQWIVKPSAGAEDPFHVCIRWGYCSHNGDKRIYPPMTHPPLWFPPFIQVEVRQNVKCFISCYPFPINSHGHSNSGQN